MSDSIDPEVWAGMSNEARAIVHRLTRELDAERKVHATTALARDHLKRHLANRNADLDAHRDALRAAERRAEEYRVRAEGLEAALLEARSILWMAREYAEAGGTHGPEMRDYTRVFDAVHAALAATPETPEEPRDE